MVQKYELLETDEQNCISFYKLKKVTLNIKYKIKTFKNKFLLHYNKGMEHFKFIKLNKNTKTPIKGEYFKDTKELNKINTNLYNIGLIAGGNNLIILDVDEKDGGMIEWNDYLADNFEPWTMKQKTPNNGLHYIFKHHDETYTEDENDAISKRKNKS